MAAEILMIPAYLVETFEALETKREELLGFGISSDPLLRWAKVPPAHFTVVHRRALLNALGYVNLTPEAVGAHVCRVWRNGDAAHTAQTAG